MNLQIKEMLDKAEGRYFTELEGQHLLSHAEGMLVRLETLHAIERAEAAIIDETVATVMRAHATLKGDHGNVGDKLVRRDQTMVLRYAAMAMLVHDPNFIYDKMAVWLRTILFALCRPEQVMSGFHALIDACKRHLTAEDAAAVVPYIEVVVRELEENGGKAS